MPVERTTFIQELGRALVQLYDPGALRRSPLIGWLGLQGQLDATAALHRVLADAIDALKPDSSVPPGANAWRLYHVLFYRYREGFTPAEIGRDLAVGERQIRRLEESAIEVLVDQLWPQVMAEARTAEQPSSGAPAAEGGAPETPSREQELLWLEKTAPPGPVSLRDLMGSITETVQPLLEALGVTVTCQVPAELPALAVVATALRQALLHIITGTARGAPGRPIQIEGEWQPHWSHIVVRVIPRGQLAIGPMAQIDPELVRRLVRIAGGESYIGEASHDNASHDDASPVSDRRIAVARLVLPIANRVPVLVVEDNRDTLALLERYLTGTRYYFVGIAQPAEVLALCEAIRPRVIVLDVMLPDTDGWALLGRLRAHPATHSLPVIVCSILPEEQLALALGAAEFLLKPVSRTALLAALNRQVRLEEPARP